MRALVSLHEDGGPMAGTERAEAELDLMHEIHTELEAVLIPSGLTAHLVFTRGIKKGGESKCH